MAQLSREEKQQLVREILDKKIGISDKDWSEITDAYDLECNPETLRKAGVGIKLADDAGMKFGNDESASIDRGFVERQKLYDIQRGVRKDLRELSRSELICETIRESIKGLPELKCGSKTDPEEEPDGNTEKDLVVGIGDFHFGADFTVNGLMGEELNRFNTEIFVYRMEDLKRDIKRIAGKETPNRITVMIAGDMLDGMLRNSQLSRLQYGLIDSAIRLSEMLCVWLADLTWETNLPVRVYAVRGNHGEIRPLGSKAGQFPEENMERIVMHYLYERFRTHPMVLIEDNDCPAWRMIDVCGYTFMLAHGQGVNIEAMAKDCVNMYHKPIDVFMVGHLHKSQSFQSGIMNGSNIMVERVPSLCGVDPYAQSLGYGGQPGATVILMEKGYGRRCVYPLVLK